MRYVNPERSNFGVLRVLDDDTVATRTGFNTHTFQNMEILQIEIIRYQENVTLRYD
jgi:redox-sensitive bicupin YhaK (pirin superfamily)